MTRRDLVVVSLEQWDQVWRRNQYLVAELLRADDELQVLFVEPPSDPLHDLRHGRPARWVRGVRDVPAIDGVAPGRVHVLRPTKLLPRRVAPGGDRRRAEAVVRAVDRLGLREPALWINDLAGAALLDVVPWPVLYDVTDDWLAAARGPAEHRRLAAAEDRVLERADAVVVCSQALAERKGSRRPVVVVTNGVDTERYARPVPRPADLPPGRTAVYVGTLHADRLDVDLCVRTARRLAEDATLVLVGPSALDGADEALLRAAGVLMLGPRPWDEVPGYLRHADALVVPHVVDSFTDSLDPIKLYEYRAVGRPVVSTPVAGFRDTSDPLVAVAVPDDLPDLVARTVTQGAPRAPRPTPDDLPTWTQQAALLAGTLDGVRTRR